MTDQPRAEAVWPDGRRLYYEGDTPEAFIEEMRRLYDLDVTVTFECPATLEDEISRRHPLGS